MPATELAANWLQRFHAGQDLPDGLAFRKALEQSGPDYTPDSLLRIDRLLRQIRRQAEPEFRAFLEPAPNRNFLFLLCFYVGGLVARYRLQTAQWYYRDELEGVLPAADIAALPADYGSSLVCTLWEGGECRAHFRPLAALVELLFGHPGAPNLLQTMDGLMQRCVQAPGLECPPPSARAAAPKPDQVLASALYRLGALAGAQLASACRRALQQGAPVEPLLRHAAASPALAAQGVTADGDDALVDAWRATQGQGAEQQGGSVLSYVTSLNLPRFRSTALALEACWLYPSVRVLVSVPYRAESQPGGFALHRPRVLEFSCRRELLPQFEAGFFAGMDSVKPPGLWAECFVDENHPDNIALRMAEQAAVQGWAPATALAVGAPTVPAADTENAAQTAAAVAAAPAARAATPAPAQATPKDPLAAVRLDDIDIAGLSAALPPADFAYPKMRMPEWIPKDPLLAVFDAMPALLRSGRVLWGYVVQAEAVLYKAGEQGATGEVVYDPSGRTPPAQLQEHAGKVAALRKELDPRRAAAQNGPPLLSVAAGELDEAPRIMGLAVPENISSLGLVLSSVYFERRHLPGGKLAGSLVPLLASDRHPGCVMLLPSRWWPDALLDLWRGPQRAEARKAWETSWTTLARAAAEADEAARAERKNAIAAYAADGVHDDHIAIMTATGHPGFTPNCKPRPREWEWGLDLELRGLARLHLVALERLRARGQAADWGEGRRAWASMQPALLIALHRRRMAEARKLDAAQFALAPDDIRHVALGLVAGCEESAQNTARVLCLARQTQNPFRPDMGPDSAAVFTLFAQYFDLPQAAARGSVRAPRLDALLQDGRWRALDAAQLQPLLEAACEEHTELITAGDFCALPIALVLMLKLRAKLGLDNPALTHPLLRSPLHPWPQPMKIDLARDAVLQSALERMQAHGYDETDILQGLTRIEAPRTELAAAPVRPRAPDKEPAQAAGAAQPEAPAARVQIPLKLRLAAFLLWVLFLVWMFGPY